MFQIRKARGAMLAALILVALTALVAAACGGDDDDDDDGDGTAVATATAYGPVTIESVATQLDPTQAFIWADVTFTEKGLKPDRLWCQGFAPDGTHTRISSTYAVLEPGLSRHGVPLDDFADGPLEVRCQSLNEVKSNIDLVRDPEKVVVSQEGHNYEIPNVSLVIDGPVVIEGTRIVPVVLTTYRSGAVDWLTGEGPVQRLVPDAAGNLTLTIKPSDQLTETFTVRVDGPDIIVVRKVDWGNGKVFENEERWVRQPDPTPQPGLTATPAAGGGETSSAPPASATAAP